MSESEIEIIAKLASECFVTDEFYFRRRPRN